MDEQTLNTFRFVVGAPRPIRLAVRGPDGNPPEIHEIDSPFVVLGRGSGSHVHLPDREVSYRHACLQVIGGRILCVDLLSAKGIQWDGPTAGPWVSAEHRLQIGPYSIQLFDDGWVYDADLPSPLDFKPRSEQRPEYGTLPEVELELLNGPGRGKTFPINRVLTLAGRDEQCRITCADERVSKIHCSLLLAPSGLWAVDVLGRDGIRINGEKVPCGYLQEGAELHIGRYGFRVHYPQPANAPPAEPAAADSAREDDVKSAMFLTRHHQVFPVSVAGETLIVTPQGDIREFFYQDIHLESNKVTHLLQTRSFRNVLIDFKDVPIVGSVILDAVAIFCRSARDGAAMCGASPEMLSVLNTMNFASIWPYYQSSDEALRTLAAPGEQVTPS